MEFYVILGVDQAASTADVKRAYRRLARKYHPDINPGDHEAEAFFRRVSEAYETLIDPDRRQDYDARGLLRETGSGAEVEFEGFDFSVSTTGEAASTFGGMIADVFADSNRAPVKNRPRVDLHATLRLRFSHALNGGRYGVTGTRVVRCEVCEGTGSRRVADGPCTSCAGSGQDRWTRGHMVFSRQCEQCGGTGRGRQRPCGVCRTEGVVARSESVDVDVPAGIADGTRLRIAKKGSVEPGGTLGDLYVTVAVEPHPLFTREGDNIHMVLPVAVHEAALGSRVEIPTISEPIRMRIPPGTQSGQRFRLRGRGATSPRTGEPGDFVVEVRLMLPRGLDERSKELIRELAEIGAEDIRADLWRKTEPE